MRLTILTTVVFAIVVAIATAQAQPEKGAQKKEVTPTAKDDTKSPNVEQYDPSRLPRDDEAFRLAKEELQTISKINEERLVQLRKKGIPHDKLQALEIEFLREYVDRELPAKRAVRSLLFSMKHRAMTAQDRLEASAKQVGGSLVAQAKEFRRMIDAKELTSPAQVERAAKMELACIELAKVREGDAKIAQTNRLELQALYRELEESDRLEPQLESVARHVLAHGVVTKEARAFVDMVRKAVNEERRSTDRLLDALRQGLQAPNNAPALIPSPEIPSEVLPFFPKQ